MISFERTPSRRSSLIYSRRKKIYHRLIRRRISAMACNKKASSAGKTASRLVSRPSAVSSGSSMVSRHSQQFYLRLRIYQNLSRCTFSLYTVLLESLRCVLTRRSLALHRVGFLFPRIANTSRSSLDELAHGYYRFANSRKVLGSRCSVCWPSSFTFSTLQRMRGYVRLNVRAMDNMLMIVISLSLS